jgi:hypothetical protein
MTRIDSLPIETFLTSLRAILQPTGAILTEIVKDEVPFECPIIYLHSLTVDDLQRLLASPSMQLVLYTIERFEFLFEDDDETRADFNEAFKQLLQYQESVVSYHLYLPYQGMLLSIYGPCQPWASAYSFAEWDFLKMQKEKDKNNQRSRVSGNRVR